MYSIKIYTDNKNKLLDILDHLEELDLVINIDRIPDIKLEPKNHSPLNQAINVSLKEEVSKKRGRPKKAKSILSIPSIATVVAKKGAKKKEKLPIFVE